MRLVLLFFAITCYILSQIRYFVNGAATCIWSREPGLNRRPAAYKAAALPTELSRRVPGDVRSTLLILAKVASLSKIWYNTMSCWSSLVAMTRDCKSLGFGLRRFESYLQHHALMSVQKIKNIGLTSLGTSPTFSTIENFQTLRGLFSALLGSALSGLIWMIISNPVHILGVLLSA